MKSTIIASALMASMALAAPVNKRAYATQTHTVVETVMVYTTVWDSPAATQAPAATSSPAAFFEQPSSAAAVTSSEAAPEVPSSTPQVIVSTPVVSSSSAAVEIPSSSAVVEIPSSSVVAEVPSSSSVAEVAETPSPTPTPTPTPAPVTSEAAPSSTAPAEAASTEPASTESSSSGASYTGSLTMNYYNNGLGACGTSISDTEMIAALSIEGFGASTYDTATGNPTNKWCNQKIRVTYNGVSADATIMDRCAGCTGEGGLDATPALWKALTGGQGGASGDRLNTGMSFTLL